MTFVAAIPDPTDTNTQRLEILCEVIGWQVNRETRVVEFKVRCWRSADAKISRRQPLLNIVLTFTPDQLSEPLIHSLISGDWNSVYACLKERLEAQF